MTQVAFFHPRDTEGVLLEIWPTDNHRVGDRYQGAGVFTRLSHIGVVTDDLDRSRKFWSNVMGFQVDTLRTSIMKGGRLIDGEDVRVLAMPVGDIERHDIVAVMPQSGGSGTGRFLERYGGSAHGTMHHFGIATPDVKAAADFVQDRGMELVAPANDEFAWIHPRSAGGMLIRSCRTRVARGEPQRDRTGSLGPPPLPRFAGSSPLERYCWRPPRGARDDDAIESRGVVDADVLPRIVRGVLRANPDLT